MIKELYTDIQGLTTTFKHQKEDILEKVCKPDRLKYLQHTLSGIKDDIENRRVVNKTEQRNAGHYYQRDSISTITDLISRFSSFKNLNVDDKIKHIVNIGVGGSDLGAKMAIEALASRHSRYEFSFVSGLDGHDINDALQRHFSRYDVNELLIIVSSKTFTTYETINNYKIAHKYLSSYTSSPEERFVAITSNIDNAINAGIKKHRCLVMDDNVGGRYSISAEMGFPLFLAIGAEDHFLFLNGMKDADSHFLNAPILDNIPALMASIDYENNSPVTCILTYSSRMKYFTEYVQQLSMESLGKHILKSDFKPSVVFGGVGTNAQHSYMQYLHQYGNNEDGIPIDFIAPIEAPEPEAKLSLSHCLAQYDLTHQGFLHKSLDYHHFGKRPSSLFLIDVLSSRTLGILISLYENKTFMQSRLYGINAFDQPGVEQGKILSHQFCNKMLDRPVDEDVLHGYSPSVTTMNIFKRIKHGNK